MRIKFFSAMAAGFVLFSAWVYPAFAHHGQASFDETKVVTIMGTVDSFEFNNPHAMLVIAVKGEKNTTQKWFGEGTSPNMLVREGWDRKTVKPGDQITATGHPARNGSFSMRIEKVLLPNGRELTFEGPGGT